MKYLSLSTRHHAVARLLALLLVGGSLLFSALPVYAQTPDVVQNLRIEPIFRGNVFVR